MAQSSRHFFRLQNAEIRQKQNHCPRRTKGLAFFACSSVSERAGDRARARAPRDKRQGGRERERERREEKRRVIERFHCCLALIILLNFFFANSLEPFDFFGEFSAVF